MKAKNTAQLWDDVWVDKPANVEKDLFRVAKEQALIRWQRMEARVLDRFGGFDGLSVIELGAGRGTNAALMAQRGAKVSVLDYSESALERSRKLFDQLNLPVEFILQDALDLPSSMHGRYDVSMSFGLAEHFLGADREKILKAHFDLLNDQGISFVSVPNAHNPPYRLYKWITEHTGRWSVGEEYPFSRRELAHYCSILDVQEYEFFGDSLWRSKKFLNPIKWFPRRKKKSRAVPAVSQVQPSDAVNEAAVSSRSGQNVALDGPAVKARKRRPRRVPKRERGTALDARFSYALVLCGGKRVRSVVRGTNDAELQD